MTSDRHRVESPGLAWVALRSGLVNIHQVEQGCPGFHRSPQPKPGAKTLPTSHTALPGSSEVRPPPGASRNFRRVHPPPLPSPPPPPTPEAIERPQIVDYGGEGYPAFTPCSMSSSAGLRSVPDANRLDFILQSFSLRPSLFLHPPPSSPYVHQASADTLGAMVWLMKLLGIESIRGPGG